MTSVIEKNRVDSIKQRIAIMQKLEQVYVSRYGREWYEKQLMNLVNQLLGMLACVGEVGGDGAGGVVDQSSTPQSEFMGTFSGLT